MGTARCVTASLGRKGVNATMRQQKHRGSVMAMSKQIPAKNRKALHERSGGICEGCGMREATQNHHRQYKSRGGSHELTNLLHLCGSGNHSGCHGVAHSGEGEARGWSVRSRFDHAVVPVLLRGAWVRLSAVPGVTPERVHTPDAVEYMVLIGAIRQGEVL